MKNKATYALLTRDVNLCHGEVIIPAGTLLSLVKSSDSFHSAMDLDAWTSKSEELTVKVPGGVCAIVPAGSFKLLFEEAA